VEKSAIQLRRSFRRQLFRTGVGVLCAACSSGDGRLASRRPGAPESTDTPNGFVQDPLDPALATPGELPPLDVNAVFGIEPAHGPFRGGQLALIRGNGFSSQVRVWFGDTEVAADQLTATRSDRVQVTVPPGVPGSVELTTQNGDDASTRRSLGAAYLYDAFYADPERAPTSGGSLITLQGQGTGWDDTTVVSIDGQACEVVGLRQAADGAQELDCQAPPGTEGLKTISVVTGARSDTVLGGFSYEPGTVPLGGLSGAALAGRLEVHVSGPGGAPIPEAYVIVGGGIDLATLNQPGAPLQQTDAAGTAVVEGDFGGKALVTIAAHCFQPRSFVDVPVDTVRVQLDPVASPDCGSTPPGSFGGSPSQPVFIQGELVWTGTAEFQRAGWVNVPEPQREGERRAAYIFQPTSDPDADFRLPREGDAITLDSPGTAGYGFQLVTGAGSRTLYAIAGVEDRSESPPRFTAYAMGLLRGLYGNPGETIDGVAIAMDRTLDQALRFDVVGPTPGAEGPDRISLHSAVEIADQTYALLPNAEVEAGVAGGNGLVIVGLPALVGDLEGSRYVIGARAYNRLTRSPPTSVLPLITALEPSQTIAVNGFLPVPTLTLGSTETLAWSGDVSVSFADPESKVSLVLYTLSSANGLITWSVTAPPSATTFHLPDLSRLPEGGLIAGALDASVSLASIDEFDYAAVTSEQMFRSGWGAYATDGATARYDDSPSP
jgi:IPT/TIG domain-containing protein